nr:hypothetical protein [Candidatus Sigynarchaeota archaeon]
MNRTLCIANAIVVDPQNGVLFEPRCINIKNGVITDDTSREMGESVIDAGGRIAIAGGIYPSFRVPLAGNALLHEGLSNVEKSFIQSGYTTIIGEGFTPFSALDAHLSFKKLKNLNKIPLIDVGNFQPMINYLKNGITNYATELSSILLDGFKGFGLSCLNPGVAARWNERHDKKIPIKGNIPFLGTSAEKILRELVILVKQPLFKSSLIIELEGPRSDATEMIEGIIEGAGGNARVTFHGVPGPVDTLSGCTMLADLPDIFEGSTHVGMNPFESNEHARVISEGFIEGEMFQRMYIPAINALESPHYHAWKIGMEALLNDPARASRNIAFSMAPMVISSTKSIAKAFACLTSVTARKALLHETKLDSIKGDAIEHLGDKQLQFTDLIYSTRALPARVAGLEGMLGGLAENKVGDVVILNSTEEKLYGQIQDPREAVKLFSEPFAVIKSGSVLYKTGIVSEETAG